MEEQAKTNLRPDVELKSMEINSFIQTNIFTIVRVYNGWIYIHVGSCEQTFVPEFYNVNADCRNYPINY